MPDYQITNKNQRDIYRFNGMKDGAYTFSFDFSPWAEDNSTVTTATWTVKAGQAAVSGKTLTSNVASALITLSEAGGSLIQLKADTGAEIKVLYIDILAKDPSAIITTDYC